MLSCNTQYCSVVARIWHDQPLQNPEKYAQNQTVVRLVRLSNALTGTLVAHHSSSDGAVIRWMERVANGLISECSATRETIDRSLAVNVEPALSVGSSRRASASTSRRCLARSADESDTFRTRLVLLESRVGKDCVRVIEGSWFDAEVDHEVDVVGGVNLARLTLYLVEEHHLPADQQPVPTKPRRNLDKGAPRLRLAPRQRGKANGCWLIHRHSPGVPRRSNAADRPTRGGRAPRRRAEQLHPWERDAMRRP